MSTREGSISEVLEGAADWAAVQGNAPFCLASLPDDSIDLVITSPPYVAQRLYLEGGRNLGVARKTEAWVDWMFAVCLESLRVCKGLCAFVVEGQTKDFRYDGAPYLLLADLIREGVCVRKPPAYRRVGIPGSGGPDWLRNDFEPVICFTSGGRLPWSDNTACGHPPKYKPGGKMSNRTKEGRRVDGRRAVPKLANPGNLVTKDSYTRAEVEALLSGAGDVIDCGAAGGGNIGSKIAHLNEAPFPEQLVDFFVKSFCPPGGVVLDMFSGSGTTVARALANGRRGIGMDLRPSQVELTRRRVAELNGGP